MCPVCHFFNNMKVNHILFALLLILASCTREALETNAVVERPALPLTKVVKISKNYDQSTLLVKFESLPSEAEIAELSALGVSEARHLFNLTEGNEALERKHGLDRWYELTLAEGTDVDGLSLSLAKLSNVATVEFNTLCENEKQEAMPAQETVITRAEALNGTFNDPMLVDQWHYRNLGSASISPNAKKGADVNVSDVWKYLCAGDPSIIVAVVDEGVAYTHPDLAANMWTNTGEIPGNGIDDDGNGYVDDVYGYNFAENGPISWGQAGDSGHATHCAGTIAAVNNNGKGVAGVAGGSGNGDGCRIMSCQIFSGNKGGAASQTARAIKYAADMGASVISCSFGYSSSFSSDNAYINSQGSVEIDAIHYFEDHKGNNDVLDGNIAIFAAGNENHNYAHYPGAFYDIISVSALGPDFLPTYYTNYGPGCNIAAPGGEYCHVVNSAKSAVLSTLPNENSDNTGYGYMQGTSMACPHVSGVVALALSYAHQRKMRFSRDEFKRMILSSVNDVDKSIASKNEKTYAYGLSPLSMAPYYHKMGTGAIDAWRLMMKMEGIPTSTIQIGKKQWVDLSPYFGTASVSLSYLDVDVPSSTVSSLGLEKISANDSAEAIPAEGYAYVQFGRLYIHPTLLGSGTLTIKAVGGGDHLGGGSNPPGGMELEAKVSLVARDTDGGNGVGGWL